MSERAAIASIRAVGRYLPMRLGLTPTAVPLEESYRSIEGQDESNQGRIASREHRLKGTVAPSTSSSSPTAPVLVGPPLIGTGAAHEEAPTSL